MNTDTQETVKTIGALRYRIAANVLGIETIELALRYKLAADVLGIAVGDPMGWHSALVTLARKYEIPPREVAIAVSDAFSRQSSQEVEQP